MHDIMLKTICNKLDFNWQHCIEFEAKPYFDLKYL